MPALPTNLVWLIVGLSAWIICALGVGLMIGTTLRALGDER